MKTVVIYHKADFDGIFCREIAKKFIGETSDTHYIGWDYGDPEPAKALIDGRENLYVLDLSVPSLMDHPNLIWIDHHKSAIEKYPSLIRGYRIDGVAACRLLWQWFILFEGNKIKTHFELPKKEKYIDRTVSEPLAVRLAGEYDIWDKRDPNAELFQHGLRSQDLNENMWDLLLTPQQYGDNQMDVGTITVEALLENGKAIQYAKSKENEEIITAHGFTRSFEGLTFLCCNHARFNSHLFTAGIKPEHDALLGFNFDGKQWRISLYHAPGKEQHDLSMIATKHGGGGHRGACGFRAPQLPFMLVFFLCLFANGCRKEQQERQLVELKNEGTNKFKVVPLFTGNPTNYEVVEANGVFALAKGAWVSTPFATCQEAVTVAEKMRRLESELDKNADAVRNELEERRKLPWKHVDCGQSPTAPSPQGSITNLAEFDNVDTNTVATIPYTFDFGPTNSFFTMMTSGVVVIDIHLDGSVVLGNTNLNEMSKLFWIRIGEMMPEMLGRYQHYFTNQQGLE